MITTCDSIFATLDKKYTSISNRQVWRLDRFMWDCEHIWETKILIKAIGDAARYPPLLESSNRVLILE